MNQLIREVTIGKWIGEGWELVKSDFWNFVLLTLIYLVLISATGSTIVVTAIIAGPLTYSYYYIILQKLRGQPFNLNDLVKGFYNFLPAFLAGLLISLFSFIGLWFCIIPFFIINAMYSFTYPLMIERKLDFWDAMEESRKLIWQNIGMFTLFTVVGGLVALLGLLLCCVGILFTMPIYYCAIVFAYRDWVGLTPESTIV